MSHREPFDVTGKTAAAAQSHSPWHSPLPYLFGALAATLSLIAFALLMLACSYWNLSGMLEANEDADERDLELAAEGGKGKEDQKAPPAYEQKILVIMAGQQKPTFIATPTASSRSSSFNDSSSSSCNSETDEKSVEMSRDRQRSTGNNPRSDT